MEILPLSKWLRRDLRCRFSPPKVQARAVCCRPRMCPAV